MKVAKMLIDTMTEAFDPEAFKDTYREEMMAMIEARAAGKDLPKGEIKAPVRDNVVNLMDVLQKSLEASKKRGDGASVSHAEAAPKKRPRRKSSAA